MRLINLLLVILLFLLASAQSCFAAELRIPIQEDTYAEEGYPTALPYDNRNFFVGYDQSADKLRTRTFLKYSLAELRNRGVLPKDITKAELSIYQYLTYASGSYSVIVSEPLAPWSEKTLTWNSQPNTRESSSATVSNATGWKNINVTDHIKKQLEESSEARGLSLKTQNEYSPGGIFWSIACHLAPFEPRCHNNEFPHLTITYNANLPPTAPSLVSPTVGSILNNPSVTFTWAESTDPNNDPITYQLLVSTTEDFTSPAYNYNTISSYSYSTNIPDGTYYWKVIASDYRTNNRGVSESAIGQFDVDTTPPPIPVLVPEPEYTYGNSNYIYWDISMQNEKYPLSFTVERLNSTTNETVNVTTQELGYNFANLAEAKYSYRVKTVDKAGNESGWSLPTSSIQDFTPPAISDLAVSERFISPNNSPQTKDFTVISFTNVEANLEKWELLIENEKHEVVKKFEGTENNVKLSWPDSSQKAIAEGSYFVRAVSTDRTGQQSRSATEVVTIDNTPPLTPNIVSPKHDSLTNKKEITARVTTVGATQNQVSLNSKQLDESTAQDQAYSLKQKIMIEGKNTFKVVAFDRAGNSASKQVEFNTDWTAPSAPKLKLALDEKKKTVSAQVQSTDFEVAEIYNLAGLHQKINKSQNPTTVVNQFSFNSKYTFYAVLTDRAGNRSAAGPHASISTPAIEDDFGIGALTDGDYTYPDVPKASTCSYKYNETTEELQRTKCIIPPSVLNKITSSTIDKKTYIISVWGSSNPKITVEVDLVKCKPFILFEPATWFGCVETHVSTSKKSVLYAGDVWTMIDGTPFMFAFRSTFNDTGVMLEIFNNTDPEGKTAATQNNVIFSIQLPNGAWLNEHLKNELSNSLIVPKATYNPVGVNRFKYFRFPFDSAVGVTQWHGKTAFQNPHKGIDFGVKKAKVYAIADGYITYAGWDNGPDKCLSGGNYLKVKHDNGMTSLYVHLENYKRKDGTKWKKGQRVLKGDLLGITGNSGVYNCKPIGYHLHFELRKDEQSKNHVNPVSWIDINWKAIPTLNWQAVKGRLTGDNPHPTY